MPNTCHSILKVYGSSQLAERVRSMISPVFGPCLSDYSNPFLKSEPDNPPLAVVRIESREVPPVMLVEEMSGQEPDLVLELLYSNWARGLRGRRVYQAGDVTSETEEAFQIEAEIETQRGDDSRAAASTRQFDSRPAARQESESGQTTAQSAETSETQPAGHERLSLRAYVKQCLDRGYALRRKSLLDRCDLTPDERDEDRECFATVDALTPNLGDADRFYIEQLEEQYSRSVRHVQHQRDLHDRLARCLCEFENPSVSYLLDAEDHERLQGLSRMLEKLANCWPSTCCQNEAAPEYDPLPW